MTSPYAHQHIFTSHGCYHEAHQDCELICPHCQAICRCTCHRIPVRRNTSWLPQ